MCQGLLFLSSVCRLQQPLAIVSNFRAVVLAFGKTGKTVLLVIKDTSIEYDMFKLGYGFGYLQFIFAVVFGCTNNPFRAFLCVFSSVSRSNNVVVTEQPPVWLGDEIIAI